MASLTRDDLTITVDRYLDRYPDERGHLAPLLHALQTGTDLTSRKEFNGGHVTCGAVVIDHDRRLLLIRHKALDAWLLPGGHIEPGDSDLVYAALRELEEETGIAWHGAVSPPGEDVLPIDIDVHRIPANPAKGEPAHWHADFRYAFWVKEPVVQLHLDEVDDHAWRPRADAPSAKLAQKITHL